MLRFPKIEELKNVSNTKKVKELNFSTVFLKAYWTDKSRNEFDRHNIEVYYFGDQEREDRPKDWKFFVRLIFEHDGKKTFVDEELYNSMSWDDANKLIEEFNQKLSTGAMTLVRANKIIKEYNEIRIENQFLK